MDKPVCGAKTRAGSPCQQRAGWGTDHVGEGRCKLHGGNAGAPKGSQNAKTHGGYARIWDGIDAAPNGLDAELDKEQHLREMFALCRMRARSVLQWLQNDRANGMADPIGAQNALTAIQREIRQLIKLQHEMETEREYEQDKIDQIIDGFEAIRSKHQG